MAISEVQRTAALMMVEDPSLKQYQIAETLGVHRNTVSKWNRDKEFLDYKNDLAMDIHRSFIADTLKVLREKSLDGRQRSHVKYLELALKTYGLLTDKIEQDVRVESKKTEEELLAELDI